MCTPAEATRAAANKEEIIKGMADTLKETFVDYLEGDSRFHDTLHEITHDYIDTEVNILNEDAKIELAMALLNSVILKAF